MKSKYLPLMATVLLGFGCAPPAEEPTAETPAVDLEAERDALMTTEDETQIAALLERYETALNASDVDAVVELYAPDGVFMPSSAPTAEGAEQVRATYEFVFSTIQLAIRFSIDEIEVHGDLAFARTGSKGTVKILADGTSAPEENRELFVFEKQGGEWKIARYIFNKTS